MWKQIAILFLIIAVSLFAASCQAGQVPGPISTATLPSPTQTATLLAATMRTSFPSETPEIAPSPTQTTTIEMELAPTDTPTASAAMPVCFTPYDVNLFAFMPDKARILVRGSSGVQIFNLETMQEDSFLQAPKNLLTAALSPDGLTLAWSLEDNTIQLIRVSDQKVLNTLEGHTDMIFKLRFSPKGDRLFSASHDTWVRIWDRNGKQEDAFQPTGADNFPSEVLGIGISPDGTQLATVPIDGPVKVWDLVEKKEVAKLGGSGGYDTSDVAFSPDGKFVAADLAEGLSLWRASGSKLLLSGVNSMAFAFSPDGRFLAYGDIDNNQVILSSPDGMNTVRTLEGSQGNIWELVFSPDSSLLASAGGEIQVWRVEDGKLLYVGKPECP